MLKETQTELLYLPGGVSQGTFFKLKNHNIRKAASTILESEMSGSVQNAALD